MPELPEVETIRRELERLVGRRITRARLHRRDMLVMPGDPPGGFARSKSDAPPKRVRRRDLLEGAVVQSLCRRGKQLAIVSDQGVICVHLGMSGQLLLAADDKAHQLDHVHASWWFDDGRELCFRDPRRFGGLWAFPSLDVLYKTRWDELGPDGLTLNTKQLRQALSGSQRAVKGVLLDQRRIAGVGNIYADEALFAAGVRPERPADSVSPTETTSLAREIRSVLRRAIKARGSSLRDHKTPDGAPGAYQLAHKVYARGGQPCRLCKETLVSQPIAQRTSVYCPRCQT